MIILTGANGYIGKELTKYFDKQNVEYTAYSRSFSVKQIKNPSKFKITNYNSIKAGGTLLYLSDNSNFEFYNKLSKNELNNQIKTTKKILNKKFNKIIYFSTALIDKELVKLQLDCYHGSFPLDRSSSPLRLDGKSYLACLSSYFLRRK